MENIRGWISSVFNLPILQRNRYNWVDYLRGVVILLVVYHHTYLGLQKSGLDVPSSIADANIVFYSFRMPLFFIVSGIFTNRSLTYKSAADLAWVKYDKILYPYFIWAFIQITLQIILSNFTNSDRTIQDYLYIFYQPRQLDQFWYLPALFNATMVFIFIKTRLQPKNSLHLILGLLLYLVSPFFDGISMLSDWMRFYLFFVIGDVVADFIFRKPVQEQAKKPATILLLLPCFIAAQVYYLRNNFADRLLNTTVFDLFNAAPGRYLYYEVSFLAIALIGCSTLIVLSFLLEKWNKLSFLRILGFHSLYIYIIHLIVIGFTRLFLIRVLHIENLGIILAVCIAFGVTIPVIFYNLLGKKQLWFLFTTRKKPATQQVIQPKLETKEILPFPKHGPVGTDVSST
jgi:fucose 4-O-acetylase-like acetyltransferase